MDAGNIITLISLTITNVVALCVVYIRQKRYNDRNYGIKNGRGDLFLQIGKLQDDMHRETQLPTYLKTSLSNGQHLKWLWCSGCHLYKMESVKEKIKNIIPA
jgi:hypothetical protein